MCLKQVETNFYLAETICFWLLGFVYHLKIFDLDNSDSFISKYLVFNWVKWVPPFTTPQPYTYFPPFPTLEMVLINRLLRWNIFLERVAVNGEDSFNWLRIKFITSSRLFINFCFKLMFHLGAINNKVLTTMSVIKNDLKISIFC